VLGDRIKIQNSFCGEIICLKMILVIVRIVVAIAGTVVIAAVNAVEVEVIFNVASRPRLNKSKN
jgi:hypothetical protein